MHKIGSLISFITSFLMILLGTLIILFVEGVISGMTQEIKTISLNKQAILILGSFQIIFGIIGMFLSKSCWKKPKGIATIILIIIYSIEIIASLIQSHYLDWNNVSSIVSFAISITVVFTLSLGFFIDKK